MGTPTPRYTLSDLPLAAKFVVTAFLLSVGLGYLSALVQLHFKGGSSPGAAIPGAKETVARFSGQDLNLWWDEYVLRKPPAAAPEPPADPDKDAKMVGGAGPQTPDVPPAAVVAGDLRLDVKGVIALRCAVCHGKDGEQEDHPLTSYDEVAKYLKPDNKFLKLVEVEPSKSGWGKDSGMSQAWTKKSDNWDEEKKLPADQLKALLEKRENERQVLVAWLKSGAEEKYYTEGYPLPPEFKGKPFPENEVKLKPAPSGSPGVTPPIEKPKETVKKPDDPRKLARKKQMAVDSLTQSTHAHLLTFCLLFGATGLIFAFSSYPGWIRGFLAPIVLVAQVADVSCWWLARLEGPGPFFALAIVATGAVVGIGLALQIVLGVFNLYDLRGKLVLLVLMLAGGGLLATLAGPAFRAQLKEEVKDLVPATSPEPAKTEPKAEAPKPGGGVHVVAKPVEKPSEPPAVMPRLEE